MDIMHTRGRFQNYDQWKTASPYDDEPDWVEEANNFMSLHANSEWFDEEFEKSLAIIEGLLEILKDEGII